MSRANVHSADWLQSVGRGMASPYSIDGYCRKARWPNSALITAPAKITGQPNFQKAFIPPRPALLSAPEDGQANRLAGRRCFYLTRFPPRSPQKNNVGMQITISGPNGG